MLWKFKYKKFLFPIVKKGRSTIITNRSNNLSINNDEK